MALFSLTSDLGHRDPYVAICKAELVKHCPDSTIVDISHEIDKFNLLQAAYIFAQAYRHFPEHSFHLIGVKGAQNQHSGFLICKWNNQFILCPDNGFITLLSEELPEEVYKINPKLFPSRPFFLKDVLIPVACTLANGGKIKDLAAEHEDYVRLLHYQPAGGPVSIRGRCIYIDSYGNVITNISKEFFERTRKGRKFNLFIPGLRITEISENYDAVPDTTALAIFNSAGFLEIAVNKARASQLLFPRSHNAHTDFNITIEFED